jgi:hypothetical protein
VTATQVASPAALEVYVENFPAGWDGCAVFGYATFLVDNPTGQAACMKPRAGSPAVVPVSGPGCSPSGPAPEPGSIAPPPSAMVRR